jgi:hypothetical protein
MDCIETPILLFECDHQVLGALPARKVFCNVFGCFYTDLQRLHPDSKHDNLHKLVGDEGLLTCLTNNDAFAIWLFLDPIDFDQVYLYRNGSIVHHTVQKVSPHNKKRQCGKCGNYDILLHDMQLNYAGWYVCIEKEGFGQAHGIFVNVTG